MPSTATSILDGLSTSVAVKAPVAAVSSGNITLSGLQGHTEDDRILVWQQTTGSENGIYAASSGSWTRTKDFDGNRDVRNGTLVPVEGSAIMYRVTTSNPIVIGTSSISFEAIGPTQTQADIGLLFYPRTDNENDAGVTPTNYYYEPGHIYRYGTNTTPGTTDMTTAIQAAINANFEIIVPDEECAFTSLTWKVRRTLRGKGPRKSVLKQLSSMDGSATPAVTFESGTPPVGGVADDIAEGCYRMDNLGWLITSQTGFYCDNDSQASMFMSDQCRIVSRQAASNGSLPYSTIANQRAIYFAAGGVSSAFFGTHRNLEIRAFDIAVDASGGVNEWTMHGWILDCRIAVRLNGCSTWDLSGVTVESGVSAARALQTFGACSNLKWIGGRWELTRPTTESGGCYGVEGDGSTIGGNWRFCGINVLISGDGSGIPGRKWSGTLPNDVVFEGTDTVGPFRVIPNANQTHRMPQRIALGGTGLGNGRITIGRNAGGADGTIEHDGTHHVITAGNSLKLRGDGTANDRLEINGTRVIVTGADGVTGYQAAMRLGTNSYLWVDSTGDLRIKQGVPASDTDGAVVGTQS